MTIERQQNTVFSTGGYSKIKHLIVSDDMRGFDAPAPVRGLAKLRLRVFGQEITNYGFNELVKRYLGWTSWLPLSVEIHHGWYTKQAPRDADLKKSIPAITVFNVRQALAWGKESKVPVYVLGAPFIHYRRGSELIVSPSAQGTIAFPMHSGSKVDAVFDIQKYCDDLIALPEELQPVNICMHEDDIKRGHHRVYMERGFAVYSAGGRAGREFAKNFYDILSQHKYSTSNGVGSYILYSVEMNIPFFLKGPSASFEGAFWEGLDTEPVWCEVETLFRDFSPVVTTAQRNFVLAESGVDDCVDREQLRPALERAVLFHPLRKLFNKVFKR